METSPQRLPIDFPKTPHSKWLQNLAFGEVLGVLWGDFGGSNDFNDLAGFFLISGQARHSRVGVFRRWRMFMQVYRNSGLPWVN